MIDLRPIADQVIVITGASSGIGLATSRLLARAGAKLVLVSRNAGELERLADECRRNGTQAVAAPADVGSFEDLERAAAAAIATFGRIDTWINNAGVAIFGTCEQVPLADHRRLFDTNYWGVVHGSLIAARYLRRSGGKIINTGSVLSDRAVMLQGPYSASKHAVKGFTDALRMELEEAGAPISVTLMKPSAIDTPYMEHARNYLGSEGTRNPPPSYDPALVAKAIAFACEHHRRELVVGFGGWAVAALGAIAPRTTDYVMEAVGRITQETSNPGQRPRRDNLYEAREDGAERSSLPGGSRKTSLFLEAQLHPATTLAGLGGAVVAGAIAWRAYRTGGAGARPAPLAGRSASRRGRLAEH